jgi:molecular chaperone GrpE
MSEKEPESMTDKRAASRLNKNDDAEMGQAPSGDPLTASEADDLTAALEKADTYYKSWQRTAADFQNYKRRIEQERGESARFASVALVINLLPVYDDLDRAVGTVDAHLAGLNWVQGVMAIHKKFNQLLTAMGVSEVAADGERFDPALHEAVANQPGEEGKILHVVQKGYRFGEKVIRPAMVIVGQADGS